LKAALLEVFGSNKSILECSSATSLGIKMGIVASIIKPELFLFTNYNGLGVREGQKYETYSVLLGNALIWEM
jgi:hypothetical protein